MFNGSIPQFVFKNILLVHNRKHPNKRMYVLGENDKNLKHYEKRKSNEWYNKVWEFDNQNAYHGFEQGKIYTWKDVFDK